MTEEPLTFQGRPLRLTYVADAWNTHTHRWVAYFRDRGCEIKVISYRDWEIPGVEVYVHSLPPLGIMRIPPFRQFHTLSDYLRVRSILNWADIVHVHFIYRFRFNILYKGVPRLVVSTWGKDIIRDTDEPEPKGEAYWKRYVLKQADVLTATTRFLAEQTRKYAPEGARINVIPFGVDLGRFDPALYPRKSPDDRPFRIGFLKHLRTKYGPDTLIEATRVIRDRDYGIRTIIAGEGEDEDNLRRLAREKGVGRIVDFVGRIPHEEVPAFLASLDVFCMPSRWESETFGVAAVEAQAMEIPVVATKVGGIPEAVNDRISGVLVPPNDSIALADAICGLLDDAESRRRMGIAGREFVKANYDWYENAARMEQIYQSILKS
jgi:glycosyltransferase involved in cell wall biosynthesis